MNITEASKVLDLSEKTVRRHIKKGAIQACIIEGSRPMTLRNYIKRGAI